MHRDRGQLVRALHLKSVHAKTGRLRFQRDDFHEVDWRRARLRVCEHHCSQEAVSASSLADQLMKRPCQRLW